MIKAFLKKIFSSVGNFITIFKDSRLNLFFAVSLLIVVSFTARILLLTYFHRDSWLQFAEKQYQGVVKLFPERGEILDRNGAPLAVSIRTSSFYVRPNHIKNKSLFAQIVSDRLNIPQEEVLKVLNRKSNFLWLLRRTEIDLKKARKIVKSILYGEKGYYKLSGEHSFKKRYPDLIGVLPEYKRVYPYGVASPVVGVINDSGNGLSGLEYILEKRGIILGERTVIYGKRDALGRVYITDPEAVFISYKKGKNVVTTIDGNIQYIVEKIISSYGKKWHPNFINAVLMDPYTGEILAAASYPFYRYGEKRGKNLLSLLNPRFINTPFEPGSVMKPIVVASALNEGIVSPMTPIKCPPDYRVGKKTFHNEFHGRNVVLAVWEVIKYSDNVGIIKIVKKLGKERYYNYLRAFGFGQKTGIELPGESAPSLRSWKKWRDVEFATLAFGHNIMVNTLQLAVAYSALINGGYLVKPRILSKIVNDKGRVTKTFSSVRLGKVLSDKTSKIMRRILVTVVEGGTGTATKLDNFFIGGKTGTAVKYDPKIRGYNRSKITATFVGFFPATDPEYVLAVTVDEPKVGKRMLWASKIAVPIFRDIAERVLLYGRVSPDKFSYKLKGEDFEKIPINRDFPFSKGFSKIGNQF